MLFLDRDGVLIYSKYRDGKFRAIRAHDELRLINGVEIFLNKARDLGFKLSMITNQPDVGDGNLDINFVNEVNHILRLKLLLDDVRVCFDRLDTKNYKPGPGMIIRSSQFLEADLHQCYFIGDSDTDILAGHRAGVSTIKYGSNLKSKLLRNRKNESQIIPHYSSRSWRKILQYIANDKS